MTTHRRRGTDCPTCNVDFWERTLDFVEGKLVPVWRCPNCCHTAPVRRRGARVDVITPAQRKAADFARAYILRTRSFDPAVEEVVEAEEKLTEWGDLVVRFHVRHRDTRCFGHVFGTTYMLWVGRNGGYRTIRTKKSDDGSRTTEILTGRDALIYCGF